MDDFSMGSAHRSRGISAPEEPCDDRIESSFLRYFVWQQVIRKRAREALTLRERLGWLPLIQVISEAAYLIEQGPKIAMLALEAASKLDFRVRHLSCHVAAPQRTQGVQDDRDVDRLL